MGKLRGVLIGFGIGIIFPYILSTIIGLILAFTTWDLSIISRLGELLFEPFVLRMSILVGIIFGTFGGFIDA